MIATLRRALADLLDPTREREIRDLRDRLSQARINAAAANAVHQLARAMQRESVESLARQLRTARDDVAALLEQAAACAHEHETDQP